MPLYESTFIARQDLSRQDVDKLANNFSGIVEAQGGKVVKNEYWGLRSLAYKINKNRKGHYVMLGIDAPAPAVKEMERNMGISEEVVRMMTIRVEELDKEPSAIMMSRGGREDGFENDNMIPDSTADADTAAEPETQE